MADSRIAVHLDDNSHLGFGARTIARGSSQPGSGRHRRPVALSRLIEHLPIRKIFEGVARIGCGAVVGAIDFGRATEVESRTRKLRFGRQILIRFFRKRLDAIDLAEQVIDGRRGVSLDHVTGPEQVVDYFLGRGEVVPVIAFVEWGLGRLERRLGRVLARFRL